MQDCFINIVLYISEVNVYWITQNQNTVSLEKYISFIIQGFQTILKYKGIYSVSWSENTLVFYFWKYIFKLCELTSVFHRVICVTFVKEGYKWM